MSDKRIQRNFIVLCSELEVDKVLPYIRQERMLTADEYEQLTQTGLPTRTKREKLLIILPRKGRDHFDVFVKCLVWSGQAELARKIGADVDAVPACPYGGEYGVIRDNIGELCVICLLISLPPPHFLLPTSSLPTSSFHITLKALI